MRRPEMTILHLHGGAFIGGKLRTYRPFAGALARRLKAEVILFLPDYRLAPEHPFPAAPMIEATWVVDPKALWRAGGMGAG